MDYSLVDITDDTYLCSAHFKNDDFICENGSYDISPTAVPSKFKYEIIFGLPMSCNLNLNIIM